MWTEVCHSENKSDDEHKSIYGNPKIHFLSSLFHNNPGIKVNVKKGTTPAQWQQCSCVCASKQACMRVYVCVCVVVKGETFTSRDQGHITRLCVQVNLCLSLTSCVNSLTHTCTHTPTHTHIRPGSWVCFCQSFSRQSFLKKGNHKETAAAADTVIIRLRFSLPPFFLPPSKHGGVQEWQLPRGRGVIIQSQDKRVRGK